MTIPFGFILRNEIAGACDGSVFSFLRNIRMVFHNGSTSLHFCQQSTRVPFPLCFQWNWFLLDVLIMVTPTKVRWLSLWFWLACYTCFICCWSLCGFPGKERLCRCFAHCGQLVVTWHKFVRSSEDYSLPGTWPTTTFYYFIDCVFILLTASSAAQKLRFNVVPLLSFCFSTCNLHINLQRCFFFFFLTDIETSENSYGNL